MMIAVNLVSGTDPNTWMIRRTSILGTNFLSAAEAAFIGWMSDVLVVARICV